MEKKKKNRPKGLIYKKSKTDLLDIEKIKEYRCRHKLSETVRHFAESSGCSERTVRNFMSSHGIKKKRKKEKIVKKPVKKVRKKKSDCVDIELLSKHLRNHSVKTTLTYFALETGLSERTIARVMKEHNLNPRKRKKEQTETIWTHI